MTSAVLFDMDGLLVDSEPFWRKAEIKAFGEKGLHLTDNDCRETMGYRLNEVIALWYARYPWTGKKPLEEMEMRILDLVTEYILTEARPMPGVREAIALCKSCGLKIAIASSSPRVLIEAVVERFNLENTFDILHSAQDETHGKPHPAVFLSAAAKLDVLPQNCIVLEDSFHGIIAGLAARMKVIAIPDPGARSDRRFGAANMILTSLEELNEKHLKK